MLQYELSGASDAPLAVPVFADLVPGPGAEAIMDGLSVAGHASLAAADFTGGAGQVQAVEAGNRLVYLVGMGADVDLEALRRAAGAMGKAARRLDRLATTLHSIDLEEAAAAVALGFALGQYDFDTYRTGDDGHGETTLVFEGGEVDAPSVDRAVIVAKAVAAARDLVNTPARDKSPQHIVDLFAGQLESAGYLVELWTGDAIVEQGFGGLAGVNAGADRPAYMLKATYEPKGAQATLAIVGKGIVFDSGGLNIKPYEFMKDMKTDMSGAAATLAAAVAIAEMGLAVNVIAITPLTENMPSGSATRPGDVLTARSGKTMEVLNTDAEGRLVLADGLSLAVELAPDLLVDVATLTGASHVALGHRIAGLWSNDDGAAGKVLAAAERAGERVWRMPLPDDYRKAIDSDVADMKNVGERYGGAIHAALFLAEFVGDTPWVHLDIAGPAWILEAEPYAPKGGAGFAVRTLVALAEDLSAG